MTEKQALLIAYNILNDELDEMEQYHDNEEYPEYYQEIKDAVETIKKMYDARP